MQIQYPYNRSRQLDILKGIGILLVMLGHAIPYTSFVHNLIYGFHMPLFFVCSGICFKARPIRESVRRDLKSLIIPWTFFSLILIACSVVLHIFSTGEVPKFNLLDENCYVLYYTIWFLLCLFITRFLYRLIYRKTMLVTTILCVITYICSYLMQLNGINLPFFIDSAMSMLLFYHLGVLLKKTITVKVPIFLPIALLLLYLSIVYFWKPLVNIKYNIFPIYLIILASMPIYSLSQICLRFDSKILVYFGLSSMAIMGLHHPIYDVLMFPLINKTALPQIVEIIMMILFTLIICLFGYKIIMKFFPFLLGKFNTNQ